MEQAPTRITTIDEIMSDPAFELGVADVRAGRGFRPDYDLWPHGNHQWSYERGRQWATVTPRNIRLKRNGKVTEAAEYWYACHFADII
jgi:arylsulfatase A-like enzyme